MRIGILGGTFDPPHNGHLGFAEAALETLQLDEVLFIPANRNPLKTERRQASAKDRLAMVQLMAEGKPNMAVSDIEIARGGPSYAVETLDELQFVRPAEYWFLVGADAVKHLESWKNPERLVRLCRLGVALRTPETQEDVLSRLKPGFADKIDFIPMKPIDVSSTEVRLRLGRKQSVTPWLDPAVLNYIHDHKLYVN